VTASLPFKLEVVEEGQPGLSLARNRAIDEALGRNADFVAFLDDDDLPQVDWLFHLIEKQKDAQADVVGSIFPPAVNPGWPEWLKRAPLFDEPKRKARTKYGAPSDFGVGSTLISRKILENLKAEGPLFVSDFGMIGCEDADFFARAWKRGATFSLAEKAVVERGYEERRLTVVGLLKDAFRIGNCITRLLEKYGTPAQIRRRKIKAIKRVCLASISFFIRVFSRALMVRSLYQISRELGVLSGRGGKK
jgi:succinoglycan biosynthesis protein ExoM